MSGRLIRDLGNGGLDSMDGGVAIPNVHFHERLINDIQHGRYQRDENLICVSWEETQFYLFSVSIRTTKPNDDHLILTVIRERSSIETFVQETYATCGLLLSKVTVSPLLFTFYHREKVICKRKGQKLLKLFKKLLQRCCGPVKELKIARLRGRFLPCSSYGHLNVEEPRHTTACATISRSEDEQRFDALFRELEDQKTLFDNFFAKQSQLFESFSRTLTDVQNLLEETGWLRQRVTSIDDVQTESESLYDEIHRDEGCLSDETESENGHNRPVSQTQHGVAVTYQTKDGPLPVKPVPFSKPVTVDDYRKAHRDAGITGDELQQNTAEIMQASRESLNAEITKIPVDATECGRESIRLLLNTDVFEGMSGLMDEIENRINTAQGTGVVSETGGDTIICLHTFRGLDMHALQSVKDIIDAFLGGLEKIAAERGIVENIGLVVLGDNEPYFHPLSKSYKEIREFLQNIKQLGKSLLTESLLFSIAAVKRGGLWKSGVFSLPPRLLIITDGQADIDERLLSAVRAMGGDHIRKTLLDHIVWISTANANKELVRRLADMSNGKYVEGREGNIVQLCSYQMHKIFSARILGSNSPKPRDQDFTAALEACGTDLNHENKEAILREVGVRKEPDYLGETHNMNNVFLHDDLPALGSRVVRGPNWMYENEDSGLPGTVINHGDDGESVWVTWDNNSPAGEYGFSDQWGCDVKLIDETRSLPMDQSLAVGVKVERGPYWSYQNEDGGPGGCGVVIRKKGKVHKVVWSNGRIHNYTYGEENFEIWRTDWAGRKTTAKSRVPTTEL